MSNLIDIKSVSQLHRLFEIEKPLHPLISVVRHTKEIKLNFENTRFNIDLYFISLKENIKGSFKYGRNSYDFEEGSLLFVAPGQIMYSNENIEPDLGGWTVFFDPRLIMNSHLANTISNYHFFSYDIHEALHLSKNEKENLTECVLKIEKEIHQSIDKHSQELIVHNIEAILKYGQRYYDRQFISRSNMSKDYLARFEVFLNSYFNQNKQLESGIPTVELCGTAMSMSGKYLSDLLKAETGKSLIEHIHLFVVNKAKNSLLATNQSIGEIAYSLGFEYSQHFSKVFKAKTGLSPNDYRKLN
jgi:AraC-like DNA-binding protein